VKDGVETMPRKLANLGPAAEYQHDHPPVRNIIGELEEKMTLGERVADRLAAVVGSWPFILIQSTLLAAWIAVNGYVLVQWHLGHLKAWDPYPFILLNLVLSFQAAYTGPVVLMSQNRHSVKDRLMALHDFELNQKAEKEIEVIMEHLAHQDRLLLDAVQRLESLQVPPPVQLVAQKIDEVLRRMEENDHRMLTLVQRTENGNSLQHR